MKILRITVKNIASLAGIQTVDFTTEPLRSAGLFGISGATGAGKSSLLDAVCLALFDATPRLRHVGNLSEIHSGEKQSDRRNLLRRGSASGFAEVVFVGVDQQTWTARWSVRRSRNRTDGKLQPSEMTLYRGNVAPGADGAIEAGGKKTLVQTAIVEKIGLTFEQFTRAVLLAQNEFATFLKASDRHRAEILQALTGTDQFERISRAVFERAAEEKKAVEALQLKLAGNEPLSPDERRAVEDSRAAARERVRLVEKDVESVRTQVAWFEQLAQKQQHLKDAESGRAEAIRQRDAAAGRRRELEQTEIVLREARALWTTRQDCRTTETTAKQALTRATQELRQRSDQLKTSADELHLAKKRRQQIADDEPEQQRQLRSARDLDARLRPLEENVAGAERRLQAAQQLQSETAESLATAETHQKSLLEDRRELQRQFEPVQDYAAFAEEAAKWVHLLREAVGARASADLAAAQLVTVREARRRQSQTVQEQQAEVLRQEAQWKSAQDALKLAEETEARFDAAAIAAQREDCHQDVQALQGLKRQLERQSELAEEIETLAKELTELQRSQKEQTAALRDLTETRLPQSEQTVAAAGALLRRIEAATDDHAQRLRASLQEEEPCPVCGSLEHPWQPHVPDTDAVALSEARLHQAELEQRHSELEAESARLQRAAESTAVRMEERSNRRKACRKLLSSLAFEDSPLVAEILAAEPSARQEEVSRRLGVRQARMAELAEQLETGQQAAAVTRTARETEQQLRETLDRLRTELASDQKVLSECEANEAVAAGAAASAQSHQQNAMVDLGTLWSSVADARRQFEEDSQAFCDTFETALATCRAMTEQLRGIESDLKSSESKAAPLQDALIQATRALESCQGDCSKAIESRDDVLNERRQLFDGRAADEVESELNVRREEADEAVRRLMAVHHTRDKERQSAEQDVRNATESVKSALSALTKADEQLAAWLTHFNERTGSHRSLQDIEEILKRDEQWIAGEDRFLQQLENAVVEADGTLRDRRTQLEIHQQQRPTADEESDVHAALLIRQEQLEEAREAETAAVAELTSDDRRRQDNQQLAEQMNQRQTDAAPWLKLNELIGSKEGDKFRMIAQRRTLDILVAYANFHLRRLAARYRLERLPESLNLVVVDEQMGDEKRSVHSLSGGESFLVSLALALGLASLTSSRMKIETLFIDEGFGSLDPETLNTAMGALMHLESQGRKVGVISHVAEMTEAIPVQVRIVRRQGGAAVIEIDGACVDSAADDEETATPADDIALIASRITEILQRAQNGGSGKVSLQALRKELGCETRQLKAAQRLLDGRVTVEGRSLRIL